MSDNKRVSFAQLMAAVAATNAKVDSILAVVPNANAPAVTAVPILDPAPATLPAWRPTPKAPKAPGAAPDVKEDVRQWAVVGNEVSKSGYPMRVFRTAMRTGGHFDVRVPHSLLRALGVL